MRTKRKVSALLAAGAMLFSLCAPFAFAEEGAGEVKDITRRPTKSTNLGPWRLIETEPPNKEKSVADLGSPTFLADIQLSLHLCLLTM